MPDINDFLAVIQARILYRINNQTEFYDSQAAMDALAVLVALFEPEPE